MCNKKVNGDYYITCKIIYTLIKLHEKRNDDDISTIRYYNFNFVIVTRRNAAQFLF